MAIRTITTKSDNLITALGGTVANNDDVYINQFSVNYTTADLSAYDLKTLTLQAGYGGEFSAATGAPLKAVVNQTATGIFRNYSNSRRVELVSSSTAGVIHTIINAPESSGQLALSTLTSVNVISITGETYFASDTIITNLYAVGGRAFMRYSTNPLTLVDAGNNSYANIQRDVVDVNVGGGSVIEFEDAVVTPSGVVNMRGGTLRPIICGTIASIAGQSGVIDFRRLTVPVTISATALGPGVTWLQTRASAPLITVTANNNVFGGPKIITME